MEFGDALLNRVTAVTRVTLRFKCLILNDLIEVTKLCFVCR